MQPVSELEAAWRQKSDEQVLEAAGCIEDYGSEGQRVILSECARRNLSLPVANPIALHDVEAVARLHRRFAGLVCAQWVSIVGMFLSAGTAVAPIAVPLALVFFVCVVAVPLTGYQLLQTLGVDRAGGTAVLMYMPLFSALTLFGMRSFNGPWSRHHGIEVGLLGPTEVCLQRLRDAERRESGST